MFDGSRWAGRGAGSDAHENPSPRRTAANPTVRAAPRRACDGGKSNGSEASCVEKSGSCASSHGRRSWDTHSSTAFCCAESTALGRRRTRSIGPSAHRRIESPEVRSHPAGGWPPTAGREEADQIRNECLRRNAGGATPGGCDMRRADPTDMRERTSLVTGLAISDVTQRTGPSNAGSLVAPGALAIVTTRRSQQPGSLRVACSGDGESAFASSAACGQQESKVTIPVNRHRCPV